MAKWTKAERAAHAINGALVAVEVATDVLLPKVDNDLMRVAAALLAAKRKYEAKAQAQRAAAKWRTGRKAAAK